MTDQHGVDYSGLDKRQRRRLRRRLARHRLPDPPIYFVLEERLPGADWRVVATGRVGETIHRPPAERFIKTAVHLED